MRRREFLSAGVSVLFTSKDLVATPPGPKWQRLRTRATAAVAVLVVILNAAYPRGALTDISTWWLTAVSVTAVLLSLRHPLWSWRITTVLLVPAPTLVTGLTTVWNWPWTPGMLLAAGTTLFAAARSYRQVVLVWLFIATMVAVWLPHRLHSEEYVVAAVVMGGVLVLGNAMRLRRIAEAERAVQQTKAATLVERAVIARELHDVVAHHMSVLVLRAGSARYRFADLPPELLTEFDELQATAREGLTEMRRLLGVLRDEDGRVETAPQPRVEEISELVTRLRDAGVAVSLETSGVGGVPDGVALSAYRIVQEALSNAVRHAPGSTVDVRITALPTELRLTITNSAATEPAQPSDERPKHGLLGMRERVTALRGTFRAEPEREGFVVAVTLPLNGNEE
ncbi:sensor histidine kinase [Lentzea sp. CA-135723]|uniref:sensor histidine kinase n=1 Tax=Lentzea sp. CA-135723 TaxID=3239950 RepID=UPI003D8E0565